MACWAREAKLKQSCSIGLNLRAVGKDLATYATPPLPFKTSQIPAKRIIRTLIEVHWGV